MSAVAERKAVRMHFRKLSDRCVSGAVLPVR